MERAGAIEPAISFVKATPPATILVGRTIEERVLVLLEPTIEGAAEIL